MAVHIKSVSGRSRASARLQSFGSHNFLKSIAVSFKIHTNMRFFGISVTVLSIDIYIYFYISLETSIPSSQKQKLLKIKT